MAVTKHSLRAIAVKLRLDRFKGVAAAYRGGASARHFVRGYRYGAGVAPTGEPLARHGGAANALESYFDANTDGPSIFKWRHYFEIYDRHLSRLRGKPVSVLEIGVAGGGSLRMWRDYLGKDSRIYGVDINPECRTLQAPGIEVFIGDQGSPAFWRDFLSRVPQLDAVIDDGSHEALHQAVTLEMLLAHLRPGGVYICEDILGCFHPFHAFVDGVTRQLSDIDQSQPPYWANGLQRQIASVHRYPFMTVIEKAASPPPAFEIAIRGSNWSGEKAFSASPAAGA